MHSKPVTIDYGNDDIRILIGTNAGYLHMFQDKNDELSESWAFIPRSLYKIINPLRDNQADTKVYGVDGPTVFFDDKNGDGVVNSDRVWAFGLSDGNYYYGLILQILILLLCGMSQWRTGDFWSRSNLVKANRNLH